MTELIPTPAKIIDLLTAFFKEVKEGKYVDKIDSLTGSNFLLEYYDVFDYQEAHSNEFRLFDYLNSEPKQFFGYAAQAIKSIYTEKQGHDKAEFLDLNVWLDKAELEITVNQAIKNKYLNKLVTIQAQVSGETEIENRLLSGIWLCPEGHEINSCIKPRKCSHHNCGSKEFELNNSKAQTESYRTLYLKDIQFNTHHSDSLIAEAVGDLSDIANSGDLIKITGYITAQQKERKLFNISHALNISVINKIDYQLTEEDKKIFEEWPKEHGFYDKLIHSIAPGIYKAELLKESFLLSYIGAPRFDKNQRHWINTLAVGDPATAKSKIAQWATKALPNVEIVSSKAGSAKGLFAGQREQIDGRKILEVGPMVRLSNRGLLCIDEFARMAEVFDVFYTPMETGVFNSATVGGHADLNTETPMYATGNPKKSNIWDQDKSVIDNLQVFEPSMLSRFDLIIIVKDESTETTDREIAKTILNLQADDKRPEVFNEVDFAKYLLYSKTINPKLTEAVSNIIVEIVADIRKQARLKLGEYQDITNRLTGTIIRLTLAIARLHLHRETTEADVSLAKTLVETVYRQRGLKVSNVNTYVDRIGQKVILILERYTKLGGLTDPEIHDKLFVDFEIEKTSILNDIGPEGPHRETNWKWRDIMESVEKSYLVDIQSLKPRRLRYKHEQTIL